MKIFSLTIMVPVVLFLTIYALGYHGERSFSSGITLPEVDVVIKNSRSLVGVPYDPLMGMHENIGAKMGFMVCSDVPNIAFGLSGYSWKRVLENDFKINPGSYDTTDYNTPNNSYFHRRARNLYSYFKGNNRLKMNSYKPAVGDFVFYKKNIAGNIAHVTLVTEITDKGYRVMESAPKTLFAQEVDYDSPINRGWILSGFGSVY